MIGIFRALWKRDLKAVPAMLAGMAFCVLFLLLFSRGGDRLAEEGRVTRIPTAVFLDKNLSHRDLVIHLLQNQELVSELCDLHFYDEEREAKSAVENGNCAILLEAPKDLFKALLTGKPANLRVTLSKRLGIEGDYFRLILRAGEKELQDSQKQIFLLYNAATGMDDIPLDEIVDDSNQAFISLSLRYALLADKSDADRGGLPPLILFFLQALMLYLLLGMPAAFLLRRDREVNHLHILAGGRIRLMMLRWAVYAVLLSFALIPLCFLPGFLALRWQSIPLIAAVLSLTVLPFAEGEGGVRKILPYHAFVLFMLLVSGRLLPPSLLPFSDQIYRRVESLLPTGILVHAALRREWTLLPVLPPLALLLILNLAIYGRRRV